MSQKIFKIVALLTFMSMSLFAITAQAALNIELTKGLRRPIPIAVVNFSDNTNQLTQVIDHDLASSGRFKLIEARNSSQQPHQDSEVNYGYWSKKGAENLLVGSIEAISESQYKINVQLLSVFAIQKAGQPSHQIFSEHFTVPKSELRALAHHISDQVYQQLTGNRGIFSTQLAYVSVQYLPNKSPTYRLMVADYDGHGAQPILISKQPIMSPSWSPDGKNLAYVSFEKNRARIYISHVASGKRKLITAFPGINGAPAWSPDGKRLALVLSKDGSPNIYVLNLNDHRLQQITYDWSIDTEPSWAPDGHSLVFTSDRGGRPQIYRYQFASGQTQRVSFNGVYNASASFVPDGSQLVLLHRDDTGFNIAVEDIATGGIQKITHNGHNESPNVAPNGQMVVFATRHGKKTELGMAAIDGSVQIRIPDKQGDVQAPAWSPIL